MRNRVVCNRDCRAFTLVELLVVVLIMSFVSAAVFGMMTAVMSQGHALNNKCDTIDSARNAMEKFGRDVRMGRSLGDVYGDLVNGGGTDTIVQGSLTFPSNNDPLYGNGLLMPTSGVNSVPFNGWPTWADGTAPQTFSCNNQTCVVQVPVFNAAGYPIAIPANVGNGGISFPKPEDNVETHIYRVVADPGNPGEYILQFAILPGLNPTVGAPRSIQMGPITLVNHIVGPLNPSTGLPRVFQYLDKTSATGAAEDVPNSQGAQATGQFVANYSGVILNLEVRSNTYSRNQPNVKPLAVKTEVFLRNNAQTTTIGGAT